MEDEREKTDTLDKSRKCLMHKICKIETKETRIGAMNKYLEPILENIRISKIEDNGNPKNKESALAINKPDSVSLEKYSSAIGLWRIKKPQMKQKANKKAKEIKTFFRWASAITGLNRIFFKDIKRK